MKTIKPEDRLPENNQYVLAYFPGRPWIDEDAKNNKHKWRVVKFIRGMSLEERKAMPDSDRRKRSWWGADEGQGNNERPYFWDEFGPGSFFGQEAKYWCELPEIHM